MKLTFILEAVLSALRLASICTMLIYLQILHLRCVQFKIIVVTTIMVTDKTQLSLYTSLFFKAGLGIETMVSTGVWLVLITRIEKFKNRV